MQVLLLMIVVSLLTSVSAAAEPYEYFLLSDGRKLVGTHDAAQERLYLAGPIPASVRVAATAIVSRRPATTVEIPAAAAPVDPAEAAERAAARIARLRASIRGYERAAQARAIDREGLTRRVAEGLANLVDVQQHQGVLAAEVAGLQSERRRLQLMRDEVEQARALTELRVVALTATIIADEHSTVVTTTISELTTELTAARSRSADLARQIAALDAVLSQRHMAMTGIQTRALRQRNDVADLERRLARYDIADQDGARRQRELEAVLTQVAAEAGSSHTPVPP